MGFFKKLSDSIRSLSNSVTKKPKTIAEYNIDVEKDSLETIAKFEEPKNTATGYFSELGKIHESDEEILKRFIKDYKIYIKNEVYNLLNNFGMLKQVPLKDFKIKMRIKYEEYDGVKEKSYIRITINIPRSRDRIKSNGNGMINIYDVLDKGRTGKDSKSERRILGWYPEARLRRGDAVFQPRKFARTVPFDYMKSNYKETFTLRKTFLVGDKKFRRISKGKMLPGIEPRNFTYALENFCYDKTKEFVKANKEKYNIDLMGMVYNLRVNGVRVYG